MRRSHRQGRKNKFFHYLKEKGYSIKFGKDITLVRRADRGLKLERNFGEEYSLESIRRRILEEKPPAIQKEERQTKKKRYVVHVKGNLPKRKIGGLRGLYLHYCFLLGILPKNRPPVSPKQLHFLLREDLAKLEQISRETRLLCRCHIDTDEQLFLIKVLCRSRWHSYQRSARGCGISAAVSKTRNIWRK